MKTVLGVEVFLAAHLDLVAGKRVALLAGPSSVDSDLRSSVESLYRHPDLNLVALFGPEHGIRGDAQAGSLVATDIDPLTKLPVYSLYGDAREPTPDMLRDIDAIIIDLQDAGVRFHTYLATTLYVMKAAERAGISVILLDRPAPISGQRVEGTVLDPSFSSFVGPASLPIRYGMTIGEVALLVNELDEIDCDLTVIRMQDWSREMWFDGSGLPFIPPSPNLPTLESMTLYPGACLIEGSNLSEGRGTTKPFEYIGAPWIDADSLANELNTLKLPGLRFRPVYINPAFSKYQGELCAGVHLFVTDRNLFQPVSAMLHVLRTIKSHYEGKFAWQPAWSDGAHLPIDLLWGSDKLRRHLDADRLVEELIDSWQQDLQAFRQLRADYILYPTS